MTTRRQQEVLDHLSQRSAFSDARANWVYGADVTVAETLARLKILNKRYDSQLGTVYWIRNEDEDATGERVPSGFIVYLNRDLTTPSGRHENFFLARARYNGTDKSFRPLLRGWMKKLGLRNKDLLNMHADLIPPVGALFQGDHVVVDEL